jgi:hypothetical protein
MGQRVLVKLAAAAAVTASLLLSATGAATASPAAPDAASAPSADASRGGGDRGVTPNAKLPATIQVDEKAFKLVATQRGTGKQVYNCVNGAYALREPVAVLTSLRGDSPVGIHGQGPFWASLVDGSRVNGSAPVAVPSPAGPSNIPWLKVTGTPLGPDGVFSKVVFIQRTDTRGGVAPASCTGTGSLAVDYSTIYQFWVKK